MSRKPVIAIVGRPNVGKSTFVNRLIGSRESIVDDQPGVTRDRLYFDVEWCGKQFTIIDTGGIVPGDEEEIMMNIYTQAEIAAEQADAIIFLVDGREGVTPVDEDIANLLRKSKKPIFLTVNKIDTPEKNLLINDFYSLSVGEPHAVSAMHGTGGIGDLLDEIFEVLPPYTAEDEDKELKIAIVGRPNVGKSSLLNALLGKERVIVSDVAGTTRDSIDTQIMCEGKGYIFVDTAGIRRKARVDYGVEKFAVARAIKAIDDADVAILMIDAVEGLTDQDKKIAAIAIDSGKPVIVAVNKWDLIEEKDSATINRFTDKIREEAPFLNFAPLLFISAKTKVRIQKLFGMAEEAYAETTKKISTNLLTRLILEVFTLNPPPSVKGKRLKAYYSTQIGSAPPSFVVFVNNTKIIQMSYIRFLEKKLREAFGFAGSPVRIGFRERSEKGS